MDMPAGGETSRDASRQKFGRLNESEARFTKAAGDGPSERWTEEKIIGEFFCRIVRSDDPGGSVKVYHGRSVPCVIDATGLMKNARA